MIKLQFGSRDRADPKLIFRHQKWELFDYYFLLMRLVWRDFYSCHSFIVREYLVYSVSGRMSLFPVNSEAKTDRYTVSAFWEGFEGNYSTIKAVEAGGTRLLKKAELDIF